MGRYEIHRTDANADELREVFEAHGASVSVLDRPVDWAVGAYGVTVLVEVKTPDGKLRPEQMHFLSEFRGWAAVVRTADDCVALLQDMRAAAK